MLHFLRPHFLRSWVCAILLLLLLPALASPQTSGVPAPPATSTEEKTEVIHGVAVSDPYQWLEDSSNPGVRSWISTQQKYTAALLNPLPDLPGIRKDVRELTDIEEAQRVLYRAGRY